MAFSLMLTFANQVQANAIAGGGNSSSYSGESVFTNVAAGGSGQFSVIFFNDGSTTWQPSVVGLLICAADKTTCNVPSPNAAYASGWFSSTVYATVSTAVQPGQNGFFIYNFTVPAGTASGTVATFNGDVGLIGSGLEFRPQGYFQINTTPGAGGGGLTISPASASLPVGGTQQFTASGAGAGATISWSVVGGCGAITSAGLFAATATNSATQPCTVVATSSDGLTGSAAVNVFGPATQLSCAANPTAVTGNGADTTVVTATLKDANGNTVSNNSSTTVAFNNNTPTLLTPTGTTNVSSNNGVASVTYTTIAGSGSGTAQISISSGTLTGCNQAITVNAVGTATKTTATFSPGTIGADGTSASRLRVIVTDANGNAITTDNATQISISRSSGATICTPGSAGPTTVASGTANFTIVSTTTPGTCSFDVTTNNTSIAGSSATLTTIIVGSPNKLGTSTSNNPSTAGCTPGTDCPVTTVTLQDANGNRVTNPPAGATVTASFGSSGCTGVSASNGATQTITTSATPSSAGRVTFTFTTATSTTGCTVTFTPGGTIATGVSATTATLVFNPGPAAGVACSFSPNPIFGDGSSTSTASVKIVDANGNGTGTGSISVTFAKNGGGTAGTTLLTTSPQTTVNGVATFTVKSAAATFGTDTYTATGTVGTGAQPKTNTCSISTI
jgi:adhesin/invasin